MLAECVHGGEFALLAEGYALLEAPLWSERHCLLFADMVAGGVRAFRDGEPVLEVWPHRKGIGGMCLHESDALIVTGKNVALRKFEGDKVAEATVALLETENPRTRFNDLVVDALGRIYVGTYDAELSLPGAIYLIDLDGSSRVVTEGALLSNGLALSPDGERLYQADTLRGEVTVFNVGSGGSLASPRTFVKMPGEKPDGISTDHEGNLLVAVSGSGRISVYAEQGEEIDRIPAPDADVTSLTFGGDGLTDLYVVSGSADMQGKGRLHRMKFHGRGCARQRCSVRY